MGHSYGSAARQSVGRVATDYSLVCAGKRIWQHTPEAPRPETPCQLNAPSCRATCPDRARTTAVAHQGVWHARGNRDTTDDVTLAGVRGHDPVARLLSLPSKTTSRHPASARRTVSCSAMPSSVPGANAETTGHPGRSRKAYSAETESCPTPECPTTRPASFRLPIIKPSP